MSEQKTLWDSIAATSSAASADGSTPSPSPDGPTSAPSGPPPVPASPSAARAKARARKTSGTSGRFCPPSSASVALTASLGNRLVAALDTNGSMEYAQTWKRKATPSGLRIFRLVPRARRTDETGCSGSQLAGWASPKAQEGGSSVEATEARMARAREKYEAGLYGSNSGPPGMNDLNHQAQLAGWPTPDAQAFGIADSRWEERREEIKEQGINGNGFGLTLGMAATLAGWPTPDTPSGGGRMTVDPLVKVRPSGAKKQLSLDDAAQMAGWPTPVAAPDALNHNSNCINGPTSLGEAATLAGWGTPSARDHKDAGPAFEADPSIVPVEGRLARQAALSEASGTPTTSSPAATESTGASRGSLNPAFSLWLMGFPLSWLICGGRAALACILSRPRKSRAAPDCSEARATPSSRRSRRSSSAPTSTAKEPES